MQRRNFLAKAIAALAAPIVPATAVPAAGVVMWGQRTTQTVLSVKHCDGNVNWDSIDNTPKKFPPASHARGHLRSIQHIDEFGFFPVRA